MGIALWLQKWHPRIKKPPVQRSVKFPCDLLRICKTEFITLLVFKKNEAWHEMEQTKVLEKVRHSLRDCKRIRRYKGCWKSKKSWSLRTCPEKTYCRREQMSEWKRKYVNAKPRKLQKIAFVMYMTIIINFQQSFWQKSTQITLPVVFLVYMYLIGLSPVFGNTFIRSKIPRSRECAGFGVQSDTKTPRSRKCAGFGFSTPWPKSRGWENLRDLGSLRDQYTVVY